MLLRPCKALQAPARPQGFFVAKSPAAMFLQCGALRKDRPRFKGTHSCCQDHSIRQWTAGRSTLLLRFCNTPQMKQSCELGTISLQGVLTIVLDVQEAVKVAGMERYMRIKQHARQLAEEQRAREKKAFILHPRKTLDPCTVPEPFALQTELREVRVCSRHGIKPHAVYVATLSTAQVVCCTLLRREV